MKLIQSRSVVGKVVDELNLVANPAFTEAVKPPSDFHWSDLVPSGWADIVPAEWKQRLPFLSTKAPPPSEPKSKKEIKKDKRQRLISYIRSQLLHVQLEPASKLVAVSVDSKDPQTATKIANAIVETYIDMGIQARLQMAKHFNKWLGDRLATIKQNLADAKKALHQFKQKQGLVDVGKVGTVLQSQLSSYMAQLHQAKLKMTKLGSAYHKIQQADSPEELESVSALLADSAVRAAKSRMVRARQKVQTLSAQYGPKHPKMIHAQAMLESATEAYHQQLQAAAAGLRAKYEVAANTVSELRDVVNKIRGQVQELGSKSYKLGVLQRNVKANQQLYNTFLQRVMQTSTMGGYHRQWPGRSTRPRYRMRPSHHTRNSSWWWRLFWDCSWASL